MKRFLSIVLALCMVFALCACGNDSNNGGSDADSSKYDKISIDLSCNGQSDTANDCIGANLFKQYIEEQSGGAITVTIYNNDQLAGGNMTKGLELVMDGTVQMDIHSTSIISSIDKRLMVSCLPWTFSDYQAAKSAGKLLATPCGAYLCLSSSSAVSTAVFSPRPKPLRFRRFTDL